MIIALTCLIAVAAIVFILGVRPRDIPAPEPVSPFERLDERKAAVYENLRDLQFEYRVGKLSDEDYQNTKRDLQTELAAILAEADALAGRVARPVQPKNPQPNPADRSGDLSHAGQNGHKCPSCGATFEQDLKFCGECGKPMKAANA